MGRSAQNINAMDGFSYVNIFETKGIEYIGIIIFFLMLVPFWILLNRKSASKKLAVAGQGALLAENLRVPQGLLFTTNHTWMHLERSGKARIGLDDLLLHVTGKVHVEQIVNPGDLVRKGDPLASIHQDGKEMKIYAPITGEVKGFNHELAENPELLQEDPFRKGWICEVKPQGWVNETRSCLVAEDASRWMNEELDRVREFLLKSTGKYSQAMPGPVLQDGGELRDQTLAEMPAELWKEFEAHFLSVS